MSKTIKIFRHGETAWNAEGRLQGWLDSPLTQQGKQQACPIIEWQPDIVICSDLGRAVTTAKLLFPNMPHHQDHRLREIYLGDWQGCTIEALQQQPAYRCYQQTPHLFQPITQESFQQVTARMQEVLADIRKLPYERIAIVSHGVAIACLMIAEQQKSLEELWQYMLPGCACQIL